MILLTEIVLCTACVHYWSCHLNLAAELVAVCACKQAAYAQAPPVYLQIFMALFLLKKRHSE